MFFGDAAVLLPRAGQDSAVSVDVRDPSSPRFATGREKGSEAVSPVAMVWPCPLSVDAYAAAGREVEFPRPDCPSCTGLLVFWSGYRRYGRCQRIFVPRLRCRVTHALLPAFVLAWRLDASEAIGTVIAEVAGAAGGVRPAAVRLEVPDPKMGPQLGARQRTLACAGRSGSVSSVWIRRRGCLLVGRVQGRCRVFGRG